MAPTPPPGGPRYPALALAPAAVTREGAAHPMAGNRHYLPNAAHMRHGFSETLRRHGFAPGETEVDAAAREKTRDAQRLKARTKANERARARFRSEVSTRDVIFIHVRSQKVSRGSCSSSSSALTRP